MAGDWIKMRIDLQSHPKIVRILSATNSDKFRTIGGLHAVWSVFDTHSIDGRLEGYTPEALDHIIGWPGFSDAVIAVGWMEFDGAETLILPEFDEHNGKSGKRRAEDSKRKRGERKSDKCPQNVRKMSDSDADVLRSREEKRRVYTVTNVTDAVASPQPSAAELTKAELWQAGKSLLQASGMPQAQCGSFVGKMVKDYTDSVVVEAVRIAVVEQPADPASFLKATCQRIAGERKQGVSEKFAVNGADFSASRAAAEESMRRLGLSVPADGDIAL